MPCASCLCHHLSVFIHAGFPKEAYELTYPAPGEPELAGRVCGLLNKAGIKCKEDPAYALDHGVFIPLKLLFPKADIPVVAMSIRSDYSTSVHMAVGRALAPLREEGVLIVASGQATHNLAAFMGRGGGGGKVGQESRAFVDWLTESCTALPAKEGLERLQGWEAAPGFRAAHPQEDHLVPLLVAAAAGMEKGGRSAGAAAAGAGAGAAAAGAAAAVAADGAVKAEETAAADPASLPLGKLLVSEWVGSPETGMCMASYAFG